MRKFLIPWLLLLALHGWNAHAGTVFVSRHAEKLVGDDPFLSDEGVTRANALAELLIDANIDRIFTTDTNRTRATAAPLASRLGLEVEIYDHRAQAMLADKLRTRAGNVLVVGHSNTIAEFVASLGGEPGSEVADDEYDRLYVVTIEADGTKTELRRYGEPQRRD